MEPGGRDLAGLWSSSYWTRISTWQPGMLTVVWSKCVARSGRRGEITPSSNFPRHQKATLRLIAWSLHRWLAETWKATELFATSCKVNKTLRLLSQSYGLTNDAGKLEADTDTRRSEQTKVVTISDYVCKAVAHIIQSQLGEIIQEGRV